MLQGCSNITKVFTRDLHFDQRLWAGLQGAGNVSLLMKQNQIDRKKRLIAKMERLPAKKIPVTDFEINAEWKEKNRQRKVTDLSEEERQEQVLLLKQWSKYTMFEKMKEEYKLKKLMSMQKRALKELHRVSPHLYNQAIKIDPNQIGFKYRGPVQSLPRRGYKAPLGGFLPQEPPHSTDAE